MMDPRCAICGSRRDHHYNQAHPFGNTGRGSRFDLHEEIERQRFEGQFVIAPLSMLRCSECGDLLDFDGHCKNHGATDAG